MTFENWPRIVTEPLPTRKLWISSSNANYNAAIQASQDQLFDTPRNEANDELPI